VAVLGITLATMVQDREDLSPHETLVGVVMALAADRATGTVWLRRSTIQDRTRLSLGQLKRALSGLVRKGIVERHRTVRASVYKFHSLEEKKGEMDGPPVTHQMGYGCTPESGRPPRARVPGYTDEQWEACRVMMRDVGLDQMRSHRGGR
jgi:hypothetical protein